MPLGHRAADAIVRVLGSWPFLIGQTLAIGLWMVANVELFVQPWWWDPYPFILLNLAFSIQAAYTGPILLISQNRQEALQKAQEELQIKQLSATLHIVEALRDQILASQLTGQLGSQTKGTSDGPVSAN